MSEPAQIERPAVLAAAIAALAGAGLALALALWDVSVRQESLPAVVAIDQPALEAALSDAPVVDSSDEDSDKQQSDSDDDDDDTQVVWLVTAPDCNACREFERATMTRLLDAGVEVRAILVAPRSLADGSPGAQDVARLLKDRDWTSVHLWMQGKHEAVSDEPLDPAEQEGLLEWSRQSAERIANVMKRNDLPFDEPMLLWRNGPEWRVSVRPSEPAYREIERELAAPKA